MSRTVDLGSQASALAGLAASITSVGSSLTAVRAVSMSMLALTAGLAAAPDTAEPGQWTAMVDGDGALAVGPGLQLMIDGSFVAPRSVHAVVGDRSLMAMRVGSSMRVRLVDDIDVTADATFPAIGAAVDHLDADATLERAVARISRALDNRPDDPVDGTYPGPVVESVGGPAGSGSIGGGRIAPGVAAIGATIAGAAAVAAAAALSHRHDHQKWSPTHVAPAGGIDARSQPDPTLTPIRLAAGVELRLAESSGDWARVEASNGWSGWVDARLLAPHTDT